MNHQRFSSEKIKKFELGLISWSFPTQGQFRVLAVKDFPKNQENSRGAFDSRINYFEETLMRCGTNVLAKAATAKEEEMLFEILVSG